MEKPCQFQPFLRFYCTGCERKGWRWWPEMFQPFLRFWAAAFMIGVFVGMMLKFQPFLRFNYGNFLPSKQYAVFLVSTLLEIQLFSSRAPSSSTASTRGP